MKLGLQVEWDRSLTWQDQLELVQSAEAAGFDSTWTSEAWGSDCATVLGWLAAATTSIRLGTAIMQIPARSPTMAAMTAATLDQLSGGRFVLGLGVSGPQVSEGWYGEPFARPLLRSREYLAIVRQALERQRVAFEGQRFTLPLPGGPGKPLKMSIGPEQHRLKVLLAAMGPKNIALSAEIADGWIPTLLMPEHMGAFREHLQEGAARAGRTLDSFEIVASVNVLVDEDVERAREVMRPYLALYVGGMGSRKQNFYNDLMRRYGFEEAAERVQDLFLAGHRDEAAAALPEALVDAISLIGPVDIVRERLCVYAEAGVSTVNAMLFSEGKDARLEQIRRLAEACEGIN